MNCEGELAVCVDPETGAGIVLFEIMKVKSTVSVFGLLPVYSAGPSQPSLNKSIIEIDMARWLLRVLCYNAIKPS